MKDLLMDEGMENGGNNKTKDFFMATLKGIERKLK